MLFSRSNPSLSWRAARAASNRLHVLNRQLGAPSCARSFIRLESSSSAPSQQHVTTQYSTVNPATGETLHNFPLLKPNQVDAMVGAAADSFEAYRKTPFEERASKFQTLADLLEKRAMQYGKLITMEMGKPITSAAAEVKKCATVCRYYAENAERLLQAEVIPTDATRSLVKFEPLGIILAIMPWNFPFWQVLRFAAPAMMAGNVVLMKHAWNVPLCALAIEELFEDANFKSNEYQNIFVSEAQVETLMADPRVKAVTLTGSNRAGSAVGALAGKNNKKSVLELGGSDPFIVLADADLNKAVQTAVTARTQNAGQSCIASKRFILEQPIADQFTQMFVEEMKKVRVGDPMNESTQMGPVARPDLLQALHKQVVASQENGAKILLGGSKMNQPGCFYSPTVVANVKPGMPVFDEETFGPVAALVVAESASEAVALANRTEFGLGATIFTEDREKGEALAGQIESGMVFINGMVKSDPRLPFGGVKASGYGRECSHYGLKEFVNIKTVWMQ